MQFVIVDCGGFKEIKSIEHPNAIRELQDKFKNATIEGDANGHPRILTEDEVSEIFGGRSIRHTDTKSVIQTNVKPVKRK